MSLDCLLGPLRLANPVMAASGTFGFGFDYEPLVDPAALGAVVVKGLTLAPRAGNPPPRLVETPAGLLNSIGLANPGLNVFVAECLPRLVARGAAVIANINGDTVDEYVKMAQGLSEAPGLVALEVNLSCPNVEAGGLAFGRQPASVAHVTRAVRQVTDLPVIVKLSPNVGDIVAVAEAALEAGAHILAVANTLLGMAIDVERRRPMLARGVGGLSGPAIRPVAVRLVYEVFRATGAPIIGQGGIACGRDALEFILAGAAAVAVGTATFRQPRTMPAIVTELQQYCARERVSLAQIIGAAHGEDG